MAKGGSARLRAQIEKLKAFATINGTVEAGFFETSRYSSKDKSKDGLPLAQVARWNEFGAANRPARPFMRLAATNFSSDRKGIQYRISNRILHGQITAEQALGQIGLAMEAAIVDSIKNGNWPRNAPYTIAKKGFDSPLIDTAQMWQGVASKVNPKES